MSVEIIGLLTTLVLGIFILIGAFIALLVGNKEKIVEFSIGLAFGVIVTLIVTDLIPEIIENLKLSQIYIFIIGTIIGFTLLKLLDKYIPDHEEEKMTKNELKDNLIHIGIITSIVLVLHNIIEGMAVYSSILTSNTTLGLGMTLGVGFHNLPLGMVIASAIYQSNKSKTKTIISLLSVSISTFIGGLILFILGITNVEGLLLGGLLSITLGMLLFIALDELFPRIKGIKNKKVTFIGIVTGVLILLISLIF